MSATATTTAASSTGGKLKLYSSPGSCSMSPYFALEGSGACTSAAILPACCPSPRKPARHTTTTTRSLACAYPLAALPAAGLAYEVEKVDIRARTTETGRSFDEINPGGGVPVLQLESGEFLTEGAAIVQYIADKGACRGCASLPCDTAPLPLPLVHHNLSPATLRAAAPAGTLAPENGTLARYRLQETLSFLSSEIHARFGPLFNPTTHAETRASTIEKLKAKLSKLDARLASQPFLLGDKWTVADGYLFAMLGWPAYVSLDVSEFKNLATYKERVAAVPHVHRVLVKCGFAKDE